MSESTVVSIVTAAVGALFAAGGAWGLVRYQVAELARSDAAQRADIEALRAQLRSQELAERAADATRTREEREDRERLRDQLEGMRVQLVKLETQIALLISGRGAHLDEGSAPKKR